MITVTDIVKQRENNFGGIYRAELFFEHDILNFPAYNPFSQVYVGSIILRPNTRPYFIYFTKKASQLRETSNKGSLAGDYFEQNITLKTPRYRPALRTMSDRLRNNRVALAVQDFNGIWTLHRNLRVRSATDTGTKAQYNGTTFSFTGQSIRPSGIWDYTANPYITAQPPTEDNPPTDTGGGSTDPPTEDDCCVQTYIHSQGSAAAVWTINHNLGADIQRPVLRYNGTDLMTADYVKKISYASDNQLVVTFKTPVPGQALITEFKAP